MKFLQMHRLGAAVLVGGLVMIAASAQTQSSSTMPDAQVESNVLRQLATAPDLSTQDIQSTTVYGTVTLSGTVQSDALRSEAENLAARAAGVKKVVDELTLGDSTAAANDQNGQQPAPDSQQPAADAGTPGPNSGASGPNMVLQSDGTYAPTQPGDQGGNQPNDQGQPPLPDQADNGKPQPGYDNAAPDNGPPDGQPGPPPHQPMDNGYAPGPNGGPGAGQRAGLQVTVPSATVLHVRINRGIDANHIQLGAPFDGTVLNDVVAGGAVAIPRGATVHGTVVAAKKAGTFKGQGELSLNLTSLTLGGETYPLSTFIWQHEGPDKTAGTVNRAVGLGAIGALFGAAAGGGAGAAIGAGVGGAAGVASSASSPRGRVIVPPESVLTFSLNRPITVTTVSQQEMARLSYAAGPANPPPPGYRRYYGPNGYYYGPGPGYYYHP